ncbi:hypothetical protein SRABI83_00126 [Arthrobacter sp. Bi83]|nr:hypothetical protein SRABI83_00126 [Arthrobacter sp. Bi83]
MTLAGRSPSTPENPPGRLIQPSGEADLHGHVALSDAEFSSQRRQSPGPLWSSQIGTNNGCRSTAQHSCGQAICRTLAYVRDSADLRRLNLQCVLNSPRCLAHHGRSMPSAAVLRRRRTVLAGPGQTVNGEVPNLPRHACPRQFDNRSRPLLIDDFLSTSIHAAYTENRERIERRRIVCIPGLDEQRERLMAQFPADVRGAHVGAHSLDPGPEGNTWELPIMATGDAIPHRYPDVLHNVVHVAGAADPGQMRNDISAHTVNGDHDLIHRDCQHCRRWRPAQGNINGNCTWFVMLGLICSGFDSHGSSPLRLNASNKSGGGTPDTSRMAAKPRPTTNAIRLCKLFSRIIKVSSRRRVLLFFEL